MDEIDRGIGLQKIAPDALAGVRFAGDKQHAQPVAHARHRDHGAVVLQRQFGRAGLGLHLDDILAAMADRDIDRGVLANRHHARADAVAVDADLDIRRAALGAAEIVDPHHHARRLSDNGEARRVDDGELAVAFVPAAGDQRMDRRMNGELVGRRRVMHLAVGDQDRAGDALRRHISQGAVQTGKKLRTIVLARRRRHHHALAHLEILFARELFADRGKRSVFLGAAVLDPHALRAVDDNRRDIGERTARLMHDQRIGEHEDQCREHQRTRPRAARPHRKGEDRQARADADRAPQEEERNLRREVDAGAHLPSRSSNAGACT